MCRDQLKYGFVFYMAKSFKSVQAKSIEEWPRFFMVG